MDKVKMSQKKDDRIFEKAKVREGKGKEKEKERSKRIACYSEFKYFHMFPQREIL
jgi:hypothetical protein